jgi:cation/acetate symporter
VASGVFGIPLGFLTIYVVSLLTPAPSQEVQDLVVAVRYPKTGGASVAVTALR